MSDEESMTTEKGSPKPGISAKRQPARSFPDLVIWQKAHHFVLGVYPFTATFPMEEKYGLAIQLRRAAVSIAANIIAEGFRKRGKPDKARFMNTAEVRLRNVDTTWFWLRILATEIPRI